MASGDSLFSCEPRESLIAPPFLPAAALVARGDRMVLAFDAAVREIAAWQGTIPRQYSGLGITARLMWTGATATTGDAVWFVQFERHDPSQDLDSDLFGGTGHTVIAPTNVVSGAPTYTDIALGAAALPPGLVGGEHVRWILAREATNENDTMAGDAEIHAVELRET